MFQYPGRFKFQSFDFENISERNASRQIKISSSMSDDNGVIFFTNKLHVCVQRVLLGNFLETSTEFHYEME
jgi:hypothetical protein